MRARHSDVRKKWLEVSSGCSKESDVAKATDELAVSVQQESKNIDSPRGWEDVDRHLRGDGIQARSLGSPVTIPDSLRIIAGGAQGLTLTMALAATQGGGAEETGRATRAGGA
jgi:hypothetical protein